MQKQAQCIIVIEMIPIANFCHWDVTRILYLRVEGNNQCVYLVSSFSVSSFTGFLFDVGVIILIDGFLWQRLLGKKVIFITGTDEHGEKIATAAAACVSSPSEHSDAISQAYKTLWKDVLFLAVGFY